MHSMVEELGENEGAPHFLLQGWNGLTSISVLGGGGSISACIPSCPTLASGQSSFPFPKRVAGGWGWGQGIKNP